MKFAINLSGKTLYTRMREAGYAPAFVPSTLRRASAGNPENEQAFHRFILGRQYPKFHMYATLSDDRKTALLNLHLDQKKPSYKGSHAHNAEYDGPLVEAEATRIQSVSAA